MQPARSHIVDCVLTLTAQRVGAEAHDACRRGTYARQAAREQRSAEFEARCHEAVLKRGKSLQAVASKGSFEVKHALAVAAWRLTSKRK